MNESISSPFIRYPLGTSLLMAGILFVGLVAYPLLPVAPLPQVDFPTIQVSASLPGGSTYQALRVDGADACETACDVEFFISYEFRSRTLGLLMGAMFDAAFRRFASAFEHRADLVFGRAGTA